METLEFENVRLSLRDDGLATLTFADPERLNALTVEMVDSVQAALREVAKPRRGVRCLTITGEGRGFCAGANLQRRKARSEGERLPSAGTVEAIFHPMIRRLRDVEVPVVAAVNGPCVGIGVAIALLADYVIAADDAYFLVPFRNLASCADSGLTWLLPRAVGPARARRIIMRAERLPAAQALEWGMINEVAPTAAFREAADLVSDEFASGPTVALGTMRRLVQDAATASLDAQMEAEARGVRRTSRTKDNAAAIQAFGSKMPTTFVGA